MILKKSSRFKVRALMRVRAKRATTCKGIISKNSFGSKTKTRNEYSYVTKESL